MKRRWAPLVILPLLTAALWAATAPLEVTKAGPVGEIQNLTEANEIRVIFSQTMVALGRIPERVEAPFFQISPKVPGAFRWSGTKTLIFTPDRSQALPYSTTFQVTVTTKARSLNGQRLKRPYTFTFTTPTVRLRRTQWYRKTGEVDSPVLFILWFNQPIAPAALAKHIHLAHEPHTWKQPALPRLEDKERLEARDPQALADFDAKMKNAIGASRSSKSVPFTVAADWDKKQYPPADNLLVLETTSIPRPNAWIKVQVDDKAPGAQGQVTPPKAQDLIVRLEPPFFIGGLHCSFECNANNTNWIAFTTRVNTLKASQALKVWDITDPAKEVLLTPQAPQKEDYGSWSLYLGQTVYTFEPARTYYLTLDRSLKSEDNQTLGYTWGQTLKNWHRTAISTFQSGHGVWEAQGGTLVPYSARNLQDISLWTMSLPLEDLVPAIRKLQARDELPEGASEPLRQEYYSWRQFSEAPPVPPQTVKLRPEADVLQAYGLDLTKVLPEDGRGLVWAALQGGEPIPRSRKPEGAGLKASLIQVTNLGLTVKDSPQGALVMVTALDTGQPVPQAQVVIRSLDNTVLWSGPTGQDGIALSPPLNLRNPDDWWRPSFVVTAAKDDDIAYAMSDWNEGVMPWEFNLNYSLDEAKAQLRGLIFSDRGAYKLGETVHLKAILRNDTPQGMALFDPGHSVELVIADSRDKEVSRRIVNLNAWSAADWTYTVPKDAPMGTYTVTATSGDDRGARGEFLVAAYRRPDFRVDVDLQGESPLAGTTLKGEVTGRYLFGAPMAGQALRWNATAEAVFTVPKAITERFPEERWSFLGHDESLREKLEARSVSEGQATLDKEGLARVEVKTDIKAGWPLRYTLEGEVIDTTRQAIANRASLLAHPAPWYLGLKALPFFVDVGSPLKTEVMAVSLDGQAAVNVAITASLTRIQWHSVRQAVGHGFYEWQSERREVPAGKWTLTSNANPVPLSVPIEEGGYYELRINAHDGQGRSTQTIASFYALGAGYTAWERQDHNRIELVPERKTYRPGDQARILVKSPWEKATALLTTEREGIRTRKVFTLDSTQQTLTVPIGEKDIPNVYVSLVLLKGRSEQFSSKDQSDPGKPAFRVGYVELKVEDASKELAVSVTTDKEEYRPQAKARVEVAVKDFQGKPAQAEVTLWAVDYGVLSLTAYKTPQGRPKVWVDKALQVLTEDSRQRIISRRVLTPKGETDGGGGGREEGPTDDVRRDFRVLAFWLGSLATGADGKAITEVELPESLTTYRIMAVAHDRASRFGQGDREIRVTKPLVLRPTFPRFLALGDKATFGAVVNSQLGAAGRAEVTITSLDTNILEFQGPATHEVELAPGGSAEVRAMAVAKSVGPARVRVRAKLLDEEDAFEDTIPVRLLASPEVVAAYGEAKGEASETVMLPQGVLPDVGGLHLELSSTALVGLGEGARYLVDYPYGCAEQRASATLALLLASDLGEAFRLPGIEAGEVKAAAQKGLDSLEAYQCYDGGFDFWQDRTCGPGREYLTSYIVHVHQRAKSLGFTVNGDTLKRGLGYLDGALKKGTKVDEGWWPVYTAWQAFALKVLAEGGVNVDSNINRLYEHLDRMPLFALAYLADALAAKGEKGERLDNLLRRINNAILPEGGQAHVEELSDPHLMFLWNSNVRSTGIVLGTLVRHTEDRALVPGMVRWLMAARKKGRWGNTQENAIVMEALVDYYRRHETEVPDFTAVVTLGAKPLAKETFQGRSTEAKVTDMAMKGLLELGRPGSRQRLMFQRQGTGTLFYVTRLTYASDKLQLRGLDQGIRVSREYRLDKGTKVSKRFKPGDMVQVTLTLDLTKERRWVAVTDPIPGGFEPVESWFATTARDMVKSQREEQAAQRGDWMSFWQRGGFDHVERHDDRVMLFATRLGEGRHIYSYVCRATTAGTFRASPAHGEEMYEPEVFGRTGTDVVEVGE